jgi:hypothetical protein
MWLTGRLTPDFKTIANFRKDNGKAIRGVCRQFVMLCQQLGLFSEALVAIDWSKFKAVNNRDRNFTSTKLQRRMEEIESSIPRYLTALDTADRQEPSIAQVRTERLKDKITALKAQMKALKEIAGVLDAAPDKQVSLTDPNARSMRIRGSGIVGYNVQTAVDVKHHLIVAHEVNNNGSDRDQLSSMAIQARDAMGVQQLTVVADRGYFKGEEILACEKNGITSIIPKPLTSGSKTEGRFGKQDFIYLAQDDEYRCPAGQRLIRHSKSIEEGMTLHGYWTTACHGCTIKTQCTTGKERRIKRWEHEAVVDVVQARLDHKPEMMRVRRQTVEHPYGTLKAWMGATHFLTKSLDRVSAEMSLHVLAYNMKRVMKLLGASTLMQGIRA